MDQMSMGQEYLGLPSRTSGARYHSVTTWRSSHWVNIFSVKMSPHLVSVHAHWDPEGASETEVSNLDASVLVDEQVLRLHVAVEHSPLVAEQDSLQQLNT